MQSNANLTFAAVSEVETKNPASTTFAAAKVNPYEKYNCPQDIYQYLLPDGSKFGLFSDPYATLNFYQPKFGMQNGRYWLESILNGNDFSTHELRLIELLSEHSCMTRRQIERVLYPGLAPDSRVGIDFIKKSRSRGIICAFNWYSPIKDERSKPLSYSLTQFSAKAVDILLQRKVSRDAWLRPIEHGEGKGPAMTLYFIDLICNELFAEITRIDRLMSWQRKPIIRADQSNYFRPAAAFDVIKDKGQIFHFWAEVFRPIPDFARKTTERFMRMNTVYKALPEESRPIRVIIIADGDARIKDLDQLAKRYMPDIPVRYSTDERILNGLSKDTFLEYNHEKDSLILSTISFLQEGASGMTKSEFLKGAEVQSYDEFEE